MPEPLTDAYLQQCEQDARRFQGCWDQGTSGTLAAHTMRLLAEVRRLQVAAALPVQDSRRLTGRRVECDDVSSSTLPPPRLLGHSVLPPGVLA